MKTLNRVDLVPIEYAHEVDMLTERAQKCGMKVCDVLDIQINGEHYKELLLSGNRWQCIKYWGTAILCGEAELKAIPGLLKLMFIS